MTPDLRYLILLMVLAVGVVACGDDVQMTEPDPDPPPALSVTLTPQNVSLTVGENVNLTVGISGGAPDAQATMICESSDTGVVTATTSGTTCAISAVGEGTTTVTATVIKGEQESFASTSVTVEDDPQPEATVLDLVSGDGQTLGLNDEAAPLVVRVEDQFGNAFAGAEVTFSGDGVAHSLSSGSVTTGSDGEASVTVTSGLEEGGITVTASVDGVGAVTFTLEVEDDTPDPEAHNIVVVSGAGQTVALGEESKPLVIRVDDQFGDPFPGAQVEFSGSGVDHTLSSTSETTDVDGRASFTVTAGQEEGTIQISASAEGVGTLNFNVEVEDDAPYPEAASIERFSGNNQTLYFNQESSGLVVQVNDQFGNPFPGAEVTYSGGGVDHTLSSTTATTGANGRASVTVTAGQEEGSIRVDAEIDGVGSVTFFAEATVERVVAALEIESGDGQVGEPGEELGEVVAVRAEDALGAPLAGVEVNWQVIEGGGSVAETMIVTDSSGRAENRWTLGTSEGDNRLVATAGEADATFFAEATVSSGAIFSGRIHPVANGSLGSFRIAAIAGGVSDTVSVSASGEFEIEVTLDDPIIGPVLGLVDSEGELAPFHPMWFWEDDRGAFRDVVAIPTTWMIRSGTHQGQEVPISINLAMVTPDHLPSFYGTSYDPGHSDFIANHFIIPESYLPWSVGISHNDSNPTVTASDSTYLWGQLRELEEHLGYSMFEPTDNIEQADIIVIQDSDLPSAGQAGPKFEYEPWTMTRHVSWGSGTTDIIQIAYGVWGSGLVVFRDVSQSPPPLIWHEFIHVLGIGHGCHWVSVMSNCQPSYHPSPEDVAYLEVLHATLRAVHEADAFGSLLRALLGERKAVGLTPIPDYHQLFR